MAYVPAARLEEGLIPGLSITEHFLLTQKKPGFFIDRESGRKLAKERIAEYNIKGTPASPVESLSGGNQQRALLALVRPGAKVMLLEQPTRGLDIESVIYLWTKLKERCNQGGGHHLHLQRPGRAAALQRPHPGVLRRARCPARWTPPPPPWTSWAISSAAGTWPRSARAGAAAGAGGPDA